MADSATAEVRKIELVEKLDAWAVSKDQEGIEWLTCEGLPILNLRLAFALIGERYSG